MTCISGPPCRPGNAAELILLAQGLVVAEDQAPSGAAQGLVGGGGDHVGVRQRARVDAGRDQSREMRHVHVQVRPHLVGDAAEALEVDDPGVGRAARDDQPGLVLARERLDFLVVDPAVLAPDPVLHGVEPLAGEIRRGAVGQVSAGGERHAEDGVAGLQKREHHALVGLRPGVRLHVGERAVEELPGAGDGQALGHVDMLAAAVVAPSGIALRVLVGEHRALGFQHRTGDDVLRGDQLDPVLLAMQLVLNALREGVVGLGQGGAEECSEVGGIVGVHEILSNGCIEVRPGTVCRRGRIVPARAPRPDSSGSCGERPVVVQHSRFRHDAGTVGRRLDRRRRRFRPASDRAANERTARVGVVEVRAPGCRRWRRFWYTLSGRQHTGDIRRAAFITQCCGHGGCRRRIRNHGS